MALSHISEPVEIPRGREEVSISIGGYLRIPYSELRVSRVDEWVKSEQSVIHSNGDFVRVIIDWVGLEQGERVVARRQVIDLNSQGEIEDLVRDNVEVASDRNAISTMKI